MLHLDSERHIEKQEKNADTHGDALDVGMSFENLNSFGEMRSR